VDAGRGALSICSVRIAAAGIIEAVDSKVGHPQIAGVHHMGLSVRDLDRSIRFYCDVLGAALFREPYDGNSPSFSGRMAIVSLGALGLDLIEHASNGGEQFQPGRTGLDHLSFPTESLDDLRDCYGSTPAMFHTRAFAMSLALAACSTLLTQTGLPWSFCFSIWRSSVKARLHLAEPLAGCRPSSSANLLRL
jgi:catechol 2,3-dioxygenase-like lactoylglutathione lyase family enzyme